MCSSSLQPPREQKCSNTRVHRFTHTRDRAGAPDCRVRPAERSFFTGWGPRDTGGKGVPLDRYSGLPQKVSLWSLSSTLPQGRGWSLAWLKFPLSRQRIVLFLAGVAAPASAESPSLACGFLDHRGQQYGRRTVSQPLSHSAGRALVLSGRRHQRVPWAGAWRQTEGQMVAVFYFSHFTCLFICRVQNIALQDESGITKKMPGRGGRRKRRLSVSTEVLGG